MRVGIVILPEHRWWAAEPLWRMAEEYGFAHAWTYDHIGWRPGLERPWFDAVTTLTAAATVTSTLRIGTFASSPDFRHPVHYARQLTALDDISDGRFTLGLAAGGVGFDAHVLGGSELPASARVDRFAEFVEVLDQVLVHDSTTYRGEYFTAVDARRAPGCVQPPRMPFAIAANGTRMMRLTARYGRGWIAAGGYTDDLNTWWRAVADLSMRFTDVVAEEGGDPARIDRYLSLDAAPVYSLSSVEYFREVVGRADELGFTDVISHWPRPEEPFAGKESTVEEIASEVLPEL
ncbi:LLM class flavin-dependent oxidoreductase [Saccharopolyspora erythraea]|uniref:LLM class flavin-dependent oxidoreductase n=1 Tax=Saccharopolyspora erythraea TaxID=1836 RepID=UPI001BA58346|nr:LLM class flavin-dependent oxidoreductase [Saccharopolyspora erythraea]QUG99535.1 LLM class flavin-dependent oxidoreductase [Saccharopolyspora erythraea]